MRDIHQDAPGPNRLPPSSDETDTDSAFARRLRELRVRAGLTQRQVAEEMSGAGYSMHQTTIAKIESGDRVATVGEAVQLARVLGVGIVNLLTDPASDADRDLIEAHLVARSAAHELEERRRELAAAQAAFDAARQRHHKTRLTVNEVTAARLTARARLRQETEGIDQ